MKGIGKRLLCLGLGAVLALSLAGCTIPTMGFADYDVSAYVAAMLSSSYHAENTEFISITGCTQETAQANNADTVENAAIYFCNTYGLYPSDDQLLELQKVMRQVLALTKYTVKDEQKTDTGYYMEVEVSPITNFNKRSSDFERLKASAQEEANRASNFVSSAPEENDEADSEPQYDEYGNEISPESETSEDSTPRENTGTQKQDADTLYMNKVLDFCREELKNLVYDTPVAIPLEILQTSEGELQIDMNQVSELDKTVVYINR